MGVILMEKVQKIKKNKILFICSILLGVLFTILQICLIIFYSQNGSIYISLFSILNIIIYIVIFLCVLPVFLNYKNCLTKITALIFHNENLQVLYDNVRAFKHDFANILQGIGGYLSLKNYSGLNDYFSGLVRDFGEINNLSVLNPDVINNPAIYNIIVSKYKLANSFGISMNLEVLLDLNKINLSSYELTRVLGILLNNAIEASKECDDKIINVIFRKNGNRNEIVIENTYKNKYIDIDRIFEKNYSTKKGNSGIGLWKVHQILSKNTNLDLFTSIQNNIFKQQLEVFY